MSPWLCSSVGYVWSPSTTAFARITGRQLFSAALPDQWGTIGLAMLALFVMLTLESFPAYVEAGMDSTRGRGSAS